MVHGSNPIPLSAALASDLCSSFCIDQWNVLLQGDAEKLKTFITEDKARIEAKYQSPLTLPSFHNFVVLSNNEKAVEVGQSERRFFMLSPKRKNYAPGVWANMWYQVKDPSFQELFYQYLQTIDTSIITKGQAPMTSYKKRVQSDQAEPAVIFLKELLNDPFLMQRPMENMSDGYRMQLMEEFNTQGRFALKHREPLPAAFQNLVQQPSDDELLEKDLSDNSSVKCQVPMRHVTDCIAHFFKGQAYFKNEPRAFNKGIRKLFGKDSSMAMHDPVKGEKINYKSWAFPSVEGLRYLLEKHNYSVDD